MILHDVSEGSRLWKLFRGINQRREAAYFAFSNFSAYTGFLRYEGSTFAEVDDINEAVIVPGANLSNWRFWHRLQIETKNLRTTPVWIDHPGDMGYSGQPFTTGLPATAKVFRAYAGSLALRSTDDDLAPDDILGAWLFDDLESMLAEMRVVQLVLPDNMLIQKTGSGSGSQLTFASLLSSMRTAFNSALPQTFPTIYGAVEVDLVMSITYSPQSPSPYSGFVNSAYTPNEPTATNPHASFSVVHEFVYNNYYGIGGGRPFRFLHPTIKTQGIFTVMRSTDQTVTIPFSLLGVAYSGQFPPDILGGQSTTYYHADIIPLIHCQFADLT